MYSAEKENRGAINKKWPEKVQANDNPASWSGEVEYAAARAERDRSERIITRKWNNKDGRTQKSGH